MKKLIYWVLKNLMEITDVEIVESPEFLDYLSKDEHYYIRCEVAINRNTTPETLDYLSKDKDSWVRWRVALNPNTTPQTLDYLSKDIDCLVRWRVAENTNTSPETLKQMSIVEYNGYVKNAIKIHPNCSEETYKYLSALEIIEALQS
jgi:hypothetical protein